MVYGHFQAKNSQRHINKDNNSYKIKKEKYVFHISLKHVLEKEIPLQKLVLHYKNKDSLFQFYLNLVLGSLAG